MSRPSHKELYAKLRSALLAVSRKRIELLNPLSIAADAIELGYCISDELNAVLSDLRDETAPENYSGARPPQRSYEQKIRGLELFAFIVESRRFNCQIYFKFALENEIFWLVSLHPNRPIKEKS